MILNFTEHGDRATTTPPEARVITPNFCFQPLNRLAMIYAVILLSFLYLVLPRKKGNAAFNAPFVGSRSWLARVEFFFSAKSIVARGYNRYRDTPWKICGNDVIVLPHRYLEEIRKLPLTQASAMEANLENMQSSYTHLDVLNKTRLFVDVIKSNLTPQLGILVPTVRKELDSAFEIELSGKLGEDPWIRVHAFETLHKIVARVSTRIFGGKELRDNPKYLDTVEQYLTNIFKTAITIRLVPDWAKFPASFFLPCSWKITYNAWKARSILIPYIDLRKATVAERAIANARVSKTEFPDLLQYMIERAKGRDEESMRLASMVVSLALASNHTTTMALTEALYDICTHPEYIPELREEIETAVKGDSGWQKTTLTKMQKLDSFIKESQRMHPPSLSMSINGLRKR